MDIEELEDVLGNEFAYIYKDIIPVIHDLKLEKTAKILEIGTGMGRMAITLALNNYKVITGEPENDETEYAKQDWLESARKVKVDHLITYIPLNAEDMPFENYSNDREAALKECYRILKLNGIVCVFEPNSDAIKFIQDNKNPTHPDAVDPRNYVQELRFTSELIKRPFYDTHILRKQ